MHNQDLETNVQVGDFRILKRLGAGGMGIVYQALQVSLNRVVALKVLGGPLTRPSDIARFSREAQAAAKLHHSSIAAIHFIGQDDQVCYMAMEFIDGMALSAIIDRLRQARHAGPTIDACVQASAQDEAAAPAIRFDQPAATIDYVPATEDRYEPDSPTAEAKRLIGSPSHIRRSCEIVREAAHALGHAHAQGVIHRDIKPANLMLDRQGHIHIIDFGIARFFEDATVTHTGQLVGSPMYMSPEQATGHLAVDHRSDLYSLGLVLQELLTLRPPILAPTREGVLRKIVAKAMPPVSWQNPAIPPALEAIVHQATAKDADERYPSAGAFATDLQNYLDGRPVAARPYRYRLDQREIAAVRPTDVTVAGFAVLFAALMSLLVGLEWVWTVLFGPNPTWSNVQGLSFWLLATACYGVGRGVLRGQQWSRWGGIALGVVNMLWWLGAAFYYSPDEWMAWARSPAVVPPLIVTLVWGTVMVILGRRTTRDWMTFAGRLRSEFKQQRAEIA
jgi:serine/threonine protein kinase